MHTQPRKILRYMEDNFLKQLVEESERRGVLLDLVLTKRIDWLGKVKVCGSLGCSDDEIVEFRILHVRNRAMSRTATPDFRRANSILFKDLTCSSQVRALEGKGDQER